MGLKIRLAPRAVADLDEIRAYLVARNPRGAERVRERIDQAIITLSDFPGIGHATHVPDVNLITVLRYPYLIYYAVSDREIVVLHIRHAARAVPASDEL